MFKDSKAFSSFSVNDLEKARQFYGETLGLNTKDNEMGILELHFDNGQTVMIYPKENYKAATFTVLNFPVKDIEKAVDSLTVKGVEMERYDGFGQDGKGIARSDGRGPSIAWFKDPAGNILSIIETENAN